VGRGHTLIRDQFDPLIHRPVAGSDSPAVEFIKISTSDADAFAFPSGYTLSAVNHLTDALSRLPAAAAVGALP